MATVALVRFELVLNAEGIDRMLKAMEMMAQVAEHGGSSMFARNQAYRAAQELSRASRHFQVVSEKPEAE